MAGIGTFFLFCIFEAFSFRSSPASGLSVGQGQGEGLDAGGLAAGGWLVGLSRRFERGECVGEMWLGHF